MRLVKRMKESKVLSKLFAQLHSRDNLFVLFRF